jgi:conjugative relaxase-like TrwC/TraI family protein
MKAIPTSRGGSQAAYLWKEATSLDAPTLWEAKSELDIAIEEGVDYEELVEIAYSERLARVQAAMPPPEPWHALHGLSEVGIDHELLRDKARDDVDAALDRYETAQKHRITGVEYRHDTAPELAAMLKIDLTAELRLDDLKHLLSGKAADGHEIGGKKRSATNGSYELVCSPDKSVSVAYGLATPEERPAILRAQRIAVDQAMHQLAGKLSFLRNQRNGLDTRDPADITWVQWQHHLSRRGDPQINTHVSLINVARSRVDGRIGTIDTFLAHGFYHSVWETYHRTLAAELGKLGLPASYDTKTHATVLTGIPAPVLRHFSGRTTEAERWLQEKLGPNFASLTPHQRSAWLGHAAAKTRPPKAMYYVAGNGHAAWHARAAGQGYVPPPRFIDPRLLQNASIPHATVQQHSATKRQNEQRQSTSHDAPGEHKQRGWWKYDELQKGHGLYHGHKQ